MFRRHCATIAAVAALALSASTMPASVTTAGELKGKQKQQRLLVPAVQKVREAAARTNKTKSTALKGRSAGSQSQKRGPDGSVRFFIDGGSPR
jgi:hypothetical protein